MMRVVLLLALIAGVVAIGLAITHRDHARLRIDATHPALRLRGGVTYVGGPAPGGPFRYRPGTVRLRHDGHEVASAKLKLGEAYSFSVPAGRY
jgi:hypothetical protein